MSQPSEYPEWAMDGVVDPPDGTIIAEPSSGLKASGYSPGSRPPAQFWNWAQRLQHDWIKWLDGGKAEIQALSAMRPLRIASAPIAGDLVAVAAAPVGLLAAVGPAGLIVCGDRGAISGNVVQQRSPGSAYAGDFKAIAWDPVLSGFAAVGSLEEIQTSPTGAAWTSRNTGADTMNGIASNGGGNFVAVGDNNNIYRCSALATWTTPTSAYSADHNCVAFGAGLFVIGSDGGKIQTSPDGVTWTERTSGTAGNIRRVEYQPNHGFVAWESSTIKLLHSNDGITWTVDDTSHNNSAGAFLLLPHHVCFLSGVSAQFWETYAADTVSHIVGGLTDLGFVHGSFFEQTARQVFAVGNDGNAFILQSPFI